ERVWPGNRLQAGAEPTAIHHWAPTRARQRAAGLRLEQDLVGLAGWRLYNEAPEFAQGVLIHRLRSLSHGRALQAGEEDDLARASLAQHQNACEALGLLLGAWQEGLDGDDEVIKLVGLDPTGIHAGVHVQLLVLIGRMGRRLRSSRT